MLSYLWSPESAILTTLTDSAVVVDLSLAENFEVALENQFGCTDTLSTTQRVIDLEGDLSISADPDTIFPGQSSQLMVSGCEDCTYDWSPSSSLDRDDIADPVASPETTTEYRVTVGKEGCSTDLTITVRVPEFVCDEPFIFIPSAFTPNGDNVNDVLRVESEIIADMTLIIYDRWGEKVFEANSQDEVWDGTFEGRELPPDVYGFLLEVTCINGDTFTKQGNITLIR
ncbi:MAG: gliding motility-associated C-terminal domain-containing protein, partial [Saprospiraceae bacterium]|nr:gliding motility-associated C-terminal domain-containing protein [Saprospiraceae bacterium]